MAPSTLGVQSGRVDHEALAEVARTLLRSAPADFVADRTARQRALRGEDRELAAAVGALRKPAPAAWVVDLLVHDETHGSALDDAVALGPSLRAAQEHADPHEIATLRKQRTQVVEALAAAGADLAEQAGHAVTSAVLDQVRATIEAGMADPHAGAAIRSGLLVRPLEGVGFDPVDLDDTLAVPDAVPDAWSGSDAPPIPITAGRRGARRSRRSGPADPAERHHVDTGTDEAGAGRASRPANRDPAADRRAAREAERRARQVSRDADAALDDAESALEDVEERRTDLDRRRRDLERQLDALDGERTDLDAEAERLGHERADAERASDRAREDLVAARRRRHELD